MNFTDKHNKLSTEALKTIHSIVSKNNNEIVLVDNILDEYGSFTDELYDTFLGNRIYKGIAYTYGVVKITIESNTLLFHGCELQDGHHSTDFHIETGTICAMADFLVKNYT